MKKYIFIITVLFLNFGCNGEKKPRIAIAGLAIESSTFSPAKTVESDFKARVDDDVFSFYPFLEKDSTLRNKVNWIPTLRGHALPGGIVTRETYESLVDKTLEKLEKYLPYDGLFFDIHGAMSVEGIDDPEGDFIKKVRQIVGYDTVISTSMDLHGNVSYDLAKETDLITCYRMAPHEDAIESKRRAVTNLIERLENGKRKPLYKSRIEVPILLPGEKTSTRVEPAKSLYAKVDPETKKEGVLDAAIWVGYPWADEPRNHAVIMVTGDSKEQVKKSSEYLAKSFWNVKDEFEFIAPVGNLSESVDLAIETKTKPFIISDMGDNPTAGGAGDVTWTLDRLLKRKEFKKSDGPSLIYASIPGPKLVEKAKKLKPSKRGELEITDLNRLYMEEERLHVEVLDHGTAWLDTGTIESLMEASQFVQVIQSRQGILVGAIEAAAYHSGAIDQEQLSLLADELKGTVYGDYLKSLISN